MEEMTNSASEMVNKGNKELNAPRHLQQYRCQRFPTVLIPLPSI